MIKASLWVLALVSIMLCAEGALAQNRTFSERPEILLGLKSDRSPSLTFVDVDGDGDLDVLVANGRHWPQVNEVFVNNGRGGFTIGYSLGEELSTSYAVPAGDLDGDGDPDVVVANDAAPNMAGHSHLVFMLENSIPKYCLLVASSRGHVAILRF